MAKYRHPNLSRGLHRHEMFFPVHINNLRTVYFLTLWTLELSAPLPDLRFLCDALGSDNVALIEEGEGGAEYLYRSRLGRVMK